MKKLASVILSAVLLVSVLAAVPASAGVLRASQYLASYSASLSAAGNGQVEIGFNVGAVSVADKVGALTIVVQKKVGSSWSDVQTFNGTVANGMLAANAISNCDEITYNGTSGQQYRAVVTAYAKIGSGSDSKPFTTGEITA
jgi:hypothetical protein